VCRLFLQAMRKRLPPPEPWATPTTRSRRSSAGAGAASSIGRSYSAALTSETDGFLSQPEYVARDEVFKVCPLMSSICEHLLQEVLSDTRTRYVETAQVRLAALKREEDSIVKERDTLETAKMRHIRCGSRLR